MDRNRHSQPGHRMTRMSSGSRGRRPSKAAALTALLAVAALAALAVGLIGGGSALAERGFGVSVQASPSIAVGRLLPPPAVEPAVVPQVPADAEEAQPIATF